MALLSLGTNLAGQIAEQAIRMARANTGKNAGAVTGPFGGLQNINAQRIPNIPGPVSGGLRSIPGAGSFAEQSSGLTEGLGRLAQSGLRSFVQGDSFRAASLGSTPLNWQERALNRPDPLLQFDWNVSIIGPNGMTFPPEYVEEIQVPNVKVEAEAIFRNGSRIYVAKSDDISAVTIKVYEDNRMTATRFFRQWHQVVRAPNGDFNLPGVYKGTISVYPMDATQNNIAAIYLSGVFPTAQPNLPFTSSGERTTLDVELSVDSIDFDFF